MQSPVAETNEPLPPELNRTLAFCRCSSHCGVGSNWYFSFSCFSGGALKSHIPSLARADTEQPMAQVVAMQHSFREITCQHKMPRCARQLRPFFLISHEVLWECGASSHRFSSVRPVSPKATRGRGRTPKASRNRITATKNFGYIDRKSTRLNSSHTVISYA